jgi:alkylation response protein AidB-like acyl-CoA dehydrogenase
MNFAFTPEQEQFRQAVRAFFAEARVQDLLRQVQRAPAREEPHPEAIYRWLGERGWLAPAWPAAYGGLGKTPVENAILAEELLAAGVPDTVRVNTIDIVGSFLLLAGTPQQKERLLPAMARGELIACVLYTEPGAGSDMSSLSTRAERHGDGFKLYGKKIYSLKSFPAQYGLASVRTTPGSTAHSGISLFLVPLAAEGVTINPMLNMSDERFSEVVFDGVAVSPADAVGPLNQGWQLINAALSLERTGHDFYVKIRRWFNLVLEQARTTGNINDPLIAQQITRLRAEVEAGRLMAWRIIDQQTRHEYDAAASAMSKWYNSELASRITRLALDMEGLDGVLSRWDREAPLDGVLEAAHRETPGLTLAAGTSEIMLHIISTTMLQASH